MKCGRGGDGGDGGASAKAREPLEGSNCFEHDELARCRELWDRVARAAARMEGRLGALGIAALVHVYAKANQKPRELFCAAAREAALREIKERNRKNKGKK